MRGMRGARETGLTMVEMLVYVAVFAALGLMVATMSSGIFFATAREEAFAEVIAIKGASENYRSAPAQGGLYTSISISELVDNGYLAIMTTGTNENAYGMDVTVAGASSNTDATITYDTPDEESCNMFEQRMDDATGVKTVTCSTAGVLTLTIE